MAILEVDRRLFALKIDAVFQTEEIVVKPMHPSQAHLESYIGVTVLGDGKIAPILNIEGIAKAQMTAIHFRTDQEDKKEETFHSQSDGAQRMLLFQSGQQERFAFPLVLIHKMEILSRRQLDFVGNKRFADIDGVTTEIVTMDQAFSVSELDRELTEDIVLLPKHMRKSIGIAVSKICGIVSLIPTFNHRQSLEKGLLGTAVVDGNLTLFPDLYQMIENIDPKVVKGKGRNSTSHSSIKILLAEDNPFFRQLVRTYLRSDNYQITSTTNGQEALDCLATESFDLLLSDLEMPIMTGWELAQKVRSSDQARIRAMPLLALTALNSELDRTKALDAGFEHFLVKLERESFLDSLAAIVSVSCSDK
jgi:two-component system chemotaxis sensor kinase CheA